MTAEDLPELKHIQKGVGFLFDADFIDRLIKERPETVKILDDAFEEWSRERIEKFKKQEEENEKIRQEVQMKRIARSHGISLERLKKLLEAEKREMDERKDNQSR